MFRFTLACIGSAACLALQVAEPAIANRANGLFVYDQMGVGTALRTYPAGGVSLAGGEAGIQAPARTASRNRPSGYAPGEVLVRFDPGTSAAERRSVRAEAWPRADSHCSLSVTITPVPPYKFFSHGRHYFTAFTQYRPPSINDDICVPHSSQGT